MMFDCILLMAGTGKRSKLSFNKIKYKINDKPLFQYSLDVFLNVAECDKIILVVNEQEYDEYKSLKSDRVDVVVGGERRCDSVYQGILKSSKDYVLIHDAARPNIKEKDVLDVYNSLLLHKASCLGVKVKDTIKEVKDGFAQNTLDRNNLMQIATPQGVDRLLLLEGLKNKEINYYDDVSVLEINYGIKPKIIDGGYNNIKVTTPEDIKYIEYLLKDKKMDNYKIGHSKDTHRLVEGRKLVLGGVSIPYDKGLLGHSDADVVYHAVVESIIGALGLGDIGMHFPDTSKKYKDIDSSYFMKEAYIMMCDSGYVINNIDITIYIEEPHMKLYKDEMKRNIASLLHTEESNINIKATRGEGLGYIGRMEGISAEVVCLLKNK